MLKKQFEDIIEERKRNKTQLNKLLINFEKKRGFYES